MEMLQADDECDNKKITSKIRLCAVKLHFVVGGLFIYLTEIA